MWLEVQPRRDKKGTRWNFRIWSWHAGNFDLDAYRIFFWNDKKTFCGVLLISPAGHFSRLRQLIAKLVGDAERRSKHKRDLKFPLERHYSEYGAFSEEKMNLENYLN
jgi:hypothetical protein